MKIGDRVRIDLARDEYGITWGHMPVEDGAIGEVIRMEKREDGPRIHVRLPPEVWKFPSGLVYRPEELERIDD